MNDDGYDTTIARAFYEEHEEDRNLVNFIDKQKNSITRHSERWSQIYDFIMYHYSDDPLILNKNTSGVVITGLAYLCEEIANA